MKKNYSNKCDDFLLSLMGESLRLMESYSSMSFIKFSVIKFSLLYVLSLGSRRRKNENNELPLT